MLDRIASDSVVKIHLDAVDERIAELMEKFSNIPEFASSRSPSTREKLAAEYKEYMELLALKNDPEHHAPPAKILDSLRKQAEGDAVRA